MSEAKAQLTDLVRRAESGDDVILTRHGRPVARLVAASPPPDRAARRALLESVRASGGAGGGSGPDAAWNQDFLYDGDGLPG